MALESLVVPNIRSRREPGSLATGRPRPARLRLIPHAQPSPRTPPRRNRGDPLPTDRIAVTGAREHNLKNISVEIPRDRLVVITGLSGSGKSSLAFDTIYAEGQRRYVESLSAYARQFLGLMEKPDVDYIDGLSPAISIDQKGVSKNPRSTVATVTEIYDYLRLLYARAGIPHCLHCGQVIRSQTVQQIVDAVLAEPPGTRAMLLAPVVRHRRGEHKQVFEAVQRLGFVRVRVDGAIRDIDEEFDLDRYEWHDIDVVVDRLIIPELSGETSAEDYDATRQRIADSVEQALRLGEGILVFAPQAGEGEPERPEETFSEHFACPNPDHPPYSVGEIEPRNFSFNSPHGACPTCTGLGVQMELDPGLVVPNRKLSIAEGAIIPYQRMSTSITWYRRRLDALGQAYGFDLNTPLEDLTEQQWHAVMHGTGDESITLEYRTKRGRDRHFDVSWEGVLPSLERRYKETESDWVRNDIERYMVSVPCPACGGRTAQAGDARRQRRRTAPSPRSPAIPSPTASPGSSACAARTHRSARASGRSRARSCRRSGTGSRSSRTSASTTSRSTAPRRRYRAARGSASGWRRRSARR